VAAPQLIADADIPEHRRAWSIYAAELPNYGDAAKIPSISGLISWAYGPPPDVPNVWIAMDRGSKVHLATQLLDEKDLHWPSVSQSEEMMGYLTTWSSWRLTVDEFVAIEKPLYGTLAGGNYIVKPDRVIKRRDQIWIVDLKTKSKQGRMPTADEQRNHALGAAAQYVAVAQRLGHEAHVRGCLYLWPHKAEFVPYGRAQDIDAFADILVRWQEAQQQQAVA
jgi:hypothetical protein